MDIRQAKRRCLELRAQPGIEQWYHCEGEHNRLAESPCSGHLNIEQAVERCHEPEMSTSYFKTVLNRPGDNSVYTNSATKTGLVTDETLVCFGAVVGMPLKTISRTVVLHNRALRPVYFHSDNLISFSEDGALVGALEAHDAEILSKLSTDGQLELQLRYSTTLETDKRQRKPISGLLDVIIYGPSGRGDDVGYFLDKCGIYLQPPLGCDRNVPYYNPQSLSSLDGNTPMTFPLHQDQHSLPEEPIQSCEDFLAKFETSEDLPLTPTPNAIRTELYRHQQQALTFFKRRERGLGGPDNGHGVWTTTTNAAGAKIYTNEITGLEQVDQPQAWRGGILADEMGLGKTLSMIALIASDKDIGNISKRFNKLQTQRQFANSTLIVVPPTVLHVWEAELKQHILPGRITWAKHHLKDRFDAAAAANSPDVVFTTYQTVMNEHRKCSLNQISLFSFHWHRIILDEAHIIRNRTTATAKAIASLHATYRWAISGTPIQNNLADFASLATFLRFHPYDSPRAFDEDFIEPYRAKCIDIFVERMTKLLACVMLRRSKGTIELPEKRAVTIPVEFSVEEKAHYRSYEKPIVAMLDNTVDTGAGTGTHWFNAMQQITVLRMACNLGASATSLQSSRPRNLSDSQTIVSEIFANSLVTGDPPCAQCGRVTELSRSTPMPDGCSDVYYSACRCIFCNNCARFLSFRTPDPCACGTISPFPQALSPFPNQDTVMRTSADMSFISDSQDRMYISSKVKALVSEVVAGLPEKSVVFSFWRSSLDVVQQALETETIQCVRIDGRVSESDRQHALLQFRNDSHTKVMLLTISCGAVGIDLTAAPRVHLLEPQWNPSLEDQALARVHRIGQTHPVTTYRYFMKDSIEEYIMSVQGDKREMVKLLLSKDDQSLQQLRSILNHDLLCS